jgi:RNA polymerase sigma factor (sigma-70 family)
MSMPNQAEATLEIRGVTLSAKNAADGCGKLVPLEALFQANRQRVFALARAILKRADWAEDATQETFLKIVQHCTHHAPEKDNPNSWVLRVARNVAIEMWRKHRRHDENEFDGAEFDVIVAPQETNALDIAIDRENAGRLLRAIELLPGPLREVLVLKYIHHLEHKEIGEILQVKAENARIRLFRAIRELRVILSTDPDE